MFSEIFALLFFFSILGFVVGLIKPSLVKKDSRKSALLFFSKATVLFFVLFCVSMPAVPVSDQQSAASVPNQQSQTVAQNAPAISAVPINNADNVKSDTGEPQVKGVHTEQPVVQETKPTVQEVTQPVQTAPIVSPSVSNTVVATDNIVKEQQNISGVVKMSNANICHAPGTTYYSRTIHYTPYDSIDDCLAAGGRLPKR